MLDNFVNIYRDNSAALWKQIYDSMRAALCGGAIAAGSRLPSIRELSAELSVSRSPVENAYMRLLAEGFIESRPKSGFFVSPFIQRQDGGGVAFAAEKMPAVLYDFRSGNIDSGTADIEMWRRHLRMALNMQKEIVSRGDPQGEPQLRQALVEYCLTARGVKASWERVVIASGTQQLLTSLCRILGRGGAVAIEAPGFAQGEQIFADFGWQVRKHAALETFANAMPQLEDCALFADITSNMPQTSLSELSRRRAALLSWARSSKGFILEDDYNGELRYLSRPLPSLQGMSPERVIYIGSFSRLLLPSVRIAYMVLPEPLAAQAREKSRFYDQTASKVEQLALAEYIRGRYLERHLRRSRKIYQMKAKELLAALAAVFGGKAAVSLYETSISVKVSLKSAMSASEAKAAAEVYGAAAERIEDDGDGKIAVSLSFAGIPREKIRPGVEAFKRAWQR